VIAGKEYGTGSSRDWAAKGTRLLGVRAVLAESFERIHRANLVGMGVLPLQFRAGERAATLGLTGLERFDVVGIAAALAGPAPREVTVRATRPDGSSSSFSAVARVDTAKEVEYYRHGGILEYVLRALLRRRRSAARPPCPPRAPALPLPRPPGRASRRGPRRRQRARQGQSRSAASSSRKRDNGRTSIPSSVRWRRSVRQTRTRRTRRPGPRSPAGRRGPRRRAARHLRLERDELAATTQDEVHLGGARLRRCPVGPSVEQPRCSP